MLPVTGLNRYKPVVKPLTTSLLHRLKQKEQMKAQHTICNIFLRWTDSLGLKELFSNKFVILDQLDCVLRIYNRIFCFIENIITESYNNLAEWTVHWTLRRVQWTLFKMVTAKKSRSIGGATTWYIKQRSCIDRIIIVHEITNRIIETSYNNVLHKAKYCASQHHVIPVVEVITARLKSRDREAPNTTSRCMRLDGRYVVTSWPCRPDTRIDKYVNPINKSVN